MKLFFLQKIKMSRPNFKSGGIAVEKVITGKCRYGIHLKTEDPCYFCGFCTIDGNDYADCYRTEKPLSCHR